MKARVAIALLVLCAPAAAHDAMPTANAPLGWTYPPSCCSLRDCREMPAGAIGEGSTGYLIRSTGEVVAYGDTRLRPSPDGVYHWCSNMVALMKGRTICLFHPDRGF